MKIKFSRELWSDPMQNAANAILAESLHSIKLNLINQNLWSESIFAEYYLSAFIAMARFAKLSHQIQKSDF